jgi:CBS domain containing-hemolysin-like protein
MAEISRYILGVLIFWILDLLTLAAQSSLIYASLVRIQAFEEQSDPRIDRVLALLEKFTQARASLHLFLVVLRVLLAGFILLLVTGFQVETNIPLTILMLILAGLLIWLSEFVVEGLVARDPETWALRLSPYTQILVLILSPIVALPLAFLGKSRDEAMQPGAVTEDELKTLVDASQREGVLEQDEREMIFSIFRFGDTLAREIMVPRIDVLALDIDTPLHEAVDALLQSGYSRVPVFDDSIDNIMGLLYVKTCCGSGEREIRKPTCKASCAQVILSPRRKKSMNCWRRCRPSGSIWL